MTMWAVGLIGHFTPIVLQACDRFEMLDVDAAGIATGMVNLQALRDRSMHQFPGVAMRINIAILDPEKAVAELMRPMPGRVPYQRPLPLNTPILAYPRLTPKPMFVPCHRSASLRERST